MPPLNFPKKLLQLAPLPLASLSSACFYLAPIDEEPPAENRPPVIHELNGVTPSMGFITLNLTQGGRTQFYIKDYEDPNLEQELYHRSVIDYRSAGVSSNPITASIPRKILSGERDVLIYEFNACQAAQSYPDAIKEGKVITFYVLLADEEFKYFNQFFSALNFAHPFECNNGRAAAWVTWSIQFLGVCPST